MPNEISISLKKPFEISQQSSIELKRNAKGDTEVRVKVYSTDPKKAMNEANKIYAALAKKYISTHG